MENQNGVNVPQEDGEFNQIVEQVTDESVKKVLQTTAAQKKHFRDKSQKLEADLATERKAKLELEDKLKNLTTSETKPTFDTNKFADEINQKVELRLEGYDNSEIEDILIFAKAKGVSIKEAKESPFVKKAIDGLRQERKANATTTSPTNRTVVVNGKSANDVLRDPNASVADKDAAIQARISHKTKNQSV